MPPSPVQPGCQQLLRCGFLPPGMPEECWRFWQWHREQLGFLAPGELLKVAYGFERRLDTSVLRKERPSTFLLPCFSCGSEGSPPFGAPAVSEAPRARSLGGVTPLARLRGSPGSLAATFPCVQAKQPPLLLNTAFTLPKPSSLRRRMGALKTNKRPGERNADFGDKSSQHPPSRF